MFLWEAGVFRGVMQARILIIEDEDDIAQLISLYLNKEGMETVLCPTAEVGIEKLNQSALIW